MNCSPVLVVAVSIGLLKTSIKTYDMVRYFAEFVVGKGSVSEILIPDSTFRAKSLSLVICCPTRLVARKPRKHIIAEIKPMIHRNV